MQRRYHREITVEAIGGDFGPRALQQVLAANFGQDALRYQVSHAHFHYDDNRFAAGDAYVAEQHALLLTALADGQAPQARAAFGRLTHAVQDFYAHSNYVEHWQALHPNEDAAQIDPLAVDLLQSPQLRSGRLYYPLEALAFVPALRAWVAPLLPQDSHAQMNKDDPSRPGFAAAFVAARKRTQVEFERICQELDHASWAAFLGQE